MFQKEYSYIYDEGRIIRAVECDVTIDDDGMITAKTLVHTLRYVYDEQGNLLRKHYIPVSPVSYQMSFYETDATDGNVLKVKHNEKVYTSHSKTDSFGRKEFDELQLGWGNVSRQFLYHDGQATEEHKNSSKLKSTPTTNLVSQIILSDGRTLSYEYDAEERITKVIDSVDGTTVYTYDALGQLTEERILGATSDEDIIVNAMIYDRYGNILSKNGVTYAYPESGWTDQLIAVGDKTISYDAQGNPTSYLGHTLTWEKGRQLKSFDGNTYTYNANAIRTSKTVNGVKHTYTLDGTKILQETWNAIAEDGSASIEYLFPLYDNEESVCGILYNDIPYYFLKNLQGDVIAITNQNGQTIAQYRYDAWGKCTIGEDTSGLNIAAINPFRYRGYYYDEEIGMYYLQSRYYDPCIGRWLNVDMPELLCTVSGSVEKNSFVYGLNTPVNTIDINGFVAVSSTRNYHTISFNNWETTMIIGCITLGIEAVGVVLAIVAAIPTVGFSTAIGAAICAAGLFVFSVLSLMNLAGNNKGLNINITRKWYLRNYVGINKKEPKGYNDIWQVFTDIKPYVTKIVKQVGIAAIRKIAKKYNQVRKAVHRIIVLVKIIYDYYCGKKVAKKNYVML